MVEEDDADGLSDDEEEEDDEVVDGNHFDVEGLRESHVGKLDHLVEVSRHFHQHLPGVDLLSHVLYVVLDLLVD
eukprot:CAMPEP_0170561208 /NCGR_PEP_ID=MMETSP0211-20121228/53365_1 /TAXON_ID=311385 /ORGANISM="Pseudokeronopsis sp., Strain OXSARD2" /LENGTH=73 /DNA_ID=CAMNT_0010876437 /DNA_START=255 /DNA_END=476 /DNA_ORIENTATION=-